MIKALVVRDRIIVFLNMYHLCEPPFPSSPTAHRMSRNWKLYGTIRIYRTIGHRSTCSIFTECKSTKLPRSPQLIEMPSLARSPVAPVRFSRSEPAVKFRINRQKLSKTSISISPVPFSLYLFAVLPCSYFLLHLTFTFLCF